MYFTTWLSSCHMLVSTSPSIRLSVHWMQAWMCAQLRLSQLQSMCRSTMCWSVPRGLWSKRTMSRRKSSSPVLLPARNGGRRQTKVRRTSYCWAAETPSRVWSWPRLSKWQAMRPKQMSKSLPHNNLRPQRRLPTCQPQSGMQLPRRSYWWSVQTLLRSRLQKWLGMQLWPSLYQQGLRQSMPLR